jgi:hypothetical protein
MKYEKPQLVVLPSASAAIQSSAKGSAPVQDSLTTYLTMNAYEADE